MKKQTLLAGLILLSCCKIEIAKADAHQTLVVSESVTMGESQPGNIDSRTNGQTNVTMMDNNEESWWSSQPKNKKMLYTNLTAATAIGIWGLATWDYGSTGFRLGNEGWFEHDSKYGGADKLGHFWSTYAFSDALAGLYKSWGYEDAEEDDTRSLYAGISLNFSRLFCQNGWNKTGKSLEYIQLPYTKLKASHDLD